MQLYGILQQLPSFRYSLKKQQMIKDGASAFYEFGPGDVLKGLIRKIDPVVEVG